eukprot:8313104-Pyramimonas_sp.AAC.1
MRRGGARLAMTSSAKRRFGRQLRGENPSWTPWARCCHLATMGSHDVLQERLEEQRAERVTLLCASQ